MDSRRFGRHYVSREYTLARTREVYSTYYDVKYPGHERSAGRPLRVSPTYERLNEVGAAGGEKSGWERANWFESNAARGDESLRPRGWAGRLWSPAIGAEHVACREAAALFDETSFAKIEVAGPGAADFLERLCDNRVARDVGAITYTQMLNRRGGVECDFTVTRLAEERFGIVTGTAFRPYEAGLGFAVKLDKGEFIGRDALLGVGEPERRLCCLVLADPRSVALGSEPVRVEGEIVGRVTSGGYGYTVERSIAYAYLPAAAAEVGTAVEVEIFGEWVAGEVAREQLFDPKGERIRQ